MRHAAGFARNSFRVMRRRLQVGLCILASSFALLVTAEPESVAQNASGIKKNAVEETVNKTDTKTQVDKKIEADTHRQVEKSASVEQKKPANSRAVSTQTATTSPKKPIAQRKKKSSDRPSASGVSAIDLQLNLPDNLDAPAPASLGSQVVLPDMFAPNSVKKDRVSLDGRLLVEEDLELNPGDSSNTKRKEEVQDTNVLDTVEGAQLNIRIKMD